MTMTMARECGLGFNASSLLIMLLFFFFNGCTVVSMGNSRGVCVCASLIPRLSVN